MTGMGRGGTVWDGMGRNGVGLRWDYKNLAAVKVNSNCTSAICQALHFLPALSTCER